MELIRRFFEPPEQSFFLFGPRGTGKSTWIRNTYPGAVYIDLLDPHEERIFSARPERLEERLSTMPPPKKIIIDEVQKVPLLLSVVHRIIEQEKHYQFILTGSSARKLRRDGVDLLAGRALYHTFHPFMAAELESAWDMQKALSQGMLPVIHASAHPEKALQTYTGLYLKEEVQAEGLVRNLGAFSRFLEALSFSHASILNISNLGRESLVGRKAAEGYIDIVEDLLIGMRLPVFRRRAKRAVTAHPKFYFFDAGVFHSLRPHGPLDRSSEIDGAALEGLVFQHLRAWIAYGNNERTLSFWRTQGGSEVDFVIYGPGMFMGIEVKNATTVHPSDLRSLCAFREEYPESKTLLLHRGKDRFITKGTLCIPCETFLKNLHPSHDFDSCLA